MLLTSAGKRKVCLQLPWQGCRHGRCPKHTHVLRTDKAHTCHAGGSMKAEDLTSEVWDYIFLAGPEPQHSAIPAQTLQALRREFEFWYPFDLRVGLTSVTLQAHQRALCHPAALASKLLHADVWHEGLHQALSLPWSNKQLSGRANSEAALAIQCMHTAFDGTALSGCCCMQTSGKDLINNHLSFALYNHTAIWQNDPAKWPRSIRTNGHLLLNAEKMSKSTGEVSGKAVCLLTIQLLAN